MDETPNTKPSDACWVIKLGGSLLDLPDLAERLRTVVQQVTTKPLIVVGGGTAADLVRGWDEVHLLPTSSTHWLAVRAMEFNRRLIEPLMPEAMEVSHYEHAEKVWRHEGTALLDSWTWLQTEETLLKSLPHSWDVTSDSIAAWVTIRWRAEGLLLLKSLEAPDSYESFCDSVDAYFPRLLSQLPAFAWCNPRSDPIQVETLQFQNP